MKWIGQHIWDFISRFRNKVYFENLEGGSSTTALVVDSDGRVFTNTLSAGGGGSESIDDLSDVDTSTTAPSTNDVLKWDGSNWVPAVYNATFTFSVNYNRLDVPDSGTQTWLLVLIGSGQWQSSIVHEVGYNNGPSGAFASAPTIARTGHSITGATGGYPLTTTSNGTVATSTALNYPSALSTTYGYAQVRFTVTATHSGTTDSNGPFFNVYFRNKKFFGPQAASSLTSTQIISLSDSDWMKSTNSNLSADAYTQAQVNITCSNQYVYYCYPSRISGTPVFKINGFGTTFTSLSDVDVTNSAGFEESFKVWQSPQVYNGSLTLVVE